MKKDRPIHTVRAGQPVSAKYLNSLAAAIRANRGNVASPNGMNYVPRRSFEPTVKLEGTTYSISFYPGYVAYCDIDQPVTMQEISGIEYDLTLDPTWHSIADNQSAYVKASTDEHGAIVGDPEIYIAAQDSTVQHYEPKAGEFAGVAGEIIWKICDFAGSIDEATIGQYTVTPFMVGKVAQYYSQRPAFHNYAIEDGNTYNIVKTYDQASDEYKMRPIEQLDGEGVPIILQAADAVATKARNSIPFRRIKGENGIIVEEDGNDIKISKEECEGCGGDTFAVAYWTCSLNVTASDPPALEAERVASTPDYVTYFLDGCAYIDTPPEGFPTYPYTIIHVPLYNGIDGLGTFPTPPY